MTNDAETAALLARAGVTGALDRLAELAIVKGPLIGWGLPEPFDAFADGSVNPVDTIYAYTTAHAGIAFLKAGDMTLASEAAATLQTLATPSGLVWYSDQPADQVPGYEVTNIAGIVLAFLARFRGGPQPLAMALLHWQGRDLASDGNYHPSNWRYQIGSPRCTDLYHETLIANGLIAAGELEAAQRSIGGMWATHFNRKREPLRDHYADARAYWGPAAMAVLTKDSALLGWIEKNDPPAESGRDFEVAQAWRRLALSALIPVGV